MNYTYRQLLEALQEFSSDELDMHVTIYDRGQEAYHQPSYAGKCEGDDVVSSDHPIIIINDPDKNVSEPITEVVRTFPDVRSCEIWIEFADGSTMTTDDFLDMDECIETQIRDTFENPDMRGGSEIVKFNWRELGI